MTDHQGTTVAALPEPEEHEVPLADCHTKAVTVFVDRAEVTRSIVFTPPEQGADEGGAAPPLFVVVVKGMTTHADADSIRVKPAVGADAADTVVGLIREVSYAVHHRPRDGAADQPRVKAAREAKEAAAAEQQRLRAQLKRVKERDSLVQGYMRSMLVTPTAVPAPPGNGGGSAAAVPASGPAAGAGLDVVEKLLSFHQTHSASVDTEAAGLEEQLKNAREKESAADAELRVLRAASSGTQASRDVTIVLDGPTAAALAAAHGGAVPLTLTYVVTGASWSPTYDMRVDDLHTDPVPTAIEVTYSAVIKQATGEDWSGVSLRLSTAATHSGKGAPPLPPTRSARWARPKPAYSYGGPQLRGMTNIAMPMQSQMPPPMQSAMPHRLERRMVRALSVDAHENDSESDDDSCSAEELDGIGGGDETPRPKRSGVSATTFTIERAMTIKADNKEHKCTIAVVHCPATFRLFATPELEELAYIQARGVNGGDLTFLASDRVSVFLAGSFITKTPLRLTSPGQSFNVFLGVEAAVKVEHKTLKDVKTAGGKKKGLLQGRTKSTRVVEYRTLLNNGLARPIDITVVHLMPRPASDQIAVTLLKPPRSEVPMSGEKAAAATAAAAAADTGGGAKAADGNVAGEGELGSNSVMQNKITNNVVFTRTLAPQSKQELAFSYEVVWPHDAETGQVEVV